MPLYVAVIEEGALLRGLRTWKAPDRVTARQELSWSYKQWDEEMRSSFFCVPLTSEERADWLTWEAQGRPLWLARHLAGYAADIQDAGLLAWCRRRFDCPAQEEVLLVSDAGGPGAPRPVDVDGRLREGARRGGN